MSTPCHQQDSNIYTYLILLILITPKLYHWDINFHFCFIYSKSSAHDEEVQKLYEEMEYQIKREKERILSEVRYQFSSPSFGNWILSVKKKINGLFKHVHVLHFYTASSLKQQSIYVAPLGDIILTSSQLVFALIP